MIKERGSNPLFLLQLGTKYCNMKTDSDFNIAIFSLATGQSATIFSIAILNLVFVLGFGFRFRSWFSF